MKLSAVLRKLKLYAPAKRLTKPVSKTAASGFFKLKHFVYSRKLKHYRRSDHFSDFSPKVLVVMNSGGIGNSIEGTPVVQAIRTLWPSCTITLVTLPGELFRDWCVPDRIIDTPQDLKGKSFDHAFFTYCLFNDISYWKQLCDIGRIHEPRVRFRKYFLKPEREYILDMLRRLGYKGAAPPLYVSVKKPNFETGGSDLRICLVPGAKNEPEWRHKRWPYYGDLAEAILAKYPDSQICVIGMKDDPFPKEALADSRVIDLRGRLSLSESAWVLKTAHLAVGNDCGPMHIAYAVQTPSIVIFGPTCQIKNASAGKALALSTDIPCRPCQYTDLFRTCPDPCCMKELTTQLVMDKAEQILSRRDKE